MEGRRGGAAADVVVVGGGLAGLACALQVQAAGLEVLVVESAEESGGRIRTDEVEGFLLDRGFQVLLTAYPEARRVLDMESLELSPFRPGARIRYRGGFHLLSDPWRRPLEGMSTLRSPVGGLADKLRVGRLRYRVRKGAVDHLFQRPETTTESRLREEGFSSGFIDGFFRPFLGGIFLERELATSSRMFEFVFRMFAEGEAALPAGGMAAIPRQLAGRLSGRIRTGTRVESVDRHDVVTASGERIEAGGVVLACDRPTASRLAPYSMRRRSSRSVTCLYYAAEVAPIDEPILVLDGESDGPVNNLCVPSQVCPTYAPDGAALISVSVLQDVSRTSDAELDEAVRGQLKSWFGPGVAAWRPLRTYRIDHALPDQSPPLNGHSGQHVRLPSGLYVCGDYRATGSIEGALRSGRAAAEAMIGDLLG